MNNKFSRYNDGVVYIYRVKEKEEDFSSNVSMSSINDLDFIVKLDYEEASKRERDLEFAEQHGFSLSLKIKTRLYNHVDNKCKAIINNYLYDISHLDKSKNEMWLYLEGEKPMVREVYL